MSKGGKSRRGGRLQGSPCLRRKGSLWDFSVLEDGLFWGEFCEACCRDRSYLCSRCNESFLNMTHCQSQSRGVTNKPVPSIFGTPTPAMSGPSRRPRIPRSSLSCTQIRAVNLIRYSGCTLGVCSGFYRISAASRARAMRRRSRENLVGHSDHVDIMY